MEDLYLFGCFVCALVLVYIGALYFLRKSLREGIDYAFADLKLWILFRDQWDEKEGTVLYTWQKIIHELEDQGASRYMIKAAWDALKKEKAKRTTKEIKVKSNGEQIKMISIGGVNNA